MSGQTDLQQAKHVFQAVILTAIADGAPEGCEAAVVAKIRDEFPQIAALPDIGDIGRELHGRYIQLGLETTARAIANGIRDRDYKELAFLLCVKVMQADGETDLEEAELLGIFQDLFELSPADVKSLISRARDPKPA